MSRLVLFDIDGTLLLTGGASLRAMRRAGEELFPGKLAWDGLDTSGALDPQLFREIAARSGYEIRPGDHSAFQTTYEAHLEQELTVRRADVRRMPGVLESLELLGARDDVTLGLLTGNYPHASRLKLNAIGLDLERFLVRVFGDDGENRPALGRVASVRYRELTRQELEPSRAVIVGDTPRDVDCALKNGFRVLGVGTGKFSVADLLASGATAAVPDLSDPRALLDLLE